MPWYSPISEELDSVDAVISESLSIDNPELAEMCEYVISGGKKIRPAVCILAHKACNGTSDKLLDVAAAFEIIHDATLVHDDINDKSEIRRGRKTLHERYTVSKAIVTGDLMFAVGFRLVGSCSDDIVKAVVNASVAMADSEFLQKDFEHTPSVTVEDYMRIIRGKTAMPIYTSAKVGAMMATTDDVMIEAVGDYALAVGLAFQVIDDLLDVTGDPSKTGKAVGTDLMEGKPTMPVIYAIQDPIHGKRIKEIFSSPDLSDDEIAEALKIIQLTDAVQKCRTKADELIKDAKESLSVIPDSQFKTAMEELADYVVRRDR